MKFEGSLHFSQKPINPGVLDQVNLVPLQYHLATEHQQSPCRTTRCEKGFLSLSPLDFTKSLPSLQLQNQLREPNVFVNSVWQICGFFFFVKKICDFRLCCGRLFPLGILIDLNNQEFQIGQPTKVNRFSFSDHSLEGKGFRVVALESLCGEGGGGLRSTEGTLIW